MWIESHASLRDHPKLLDLMTLLGVERPAAIGTLHLLWWFAAMYAKDGSLTRFDPNMIASALFWPKSSTLLMTSLTRSGFLEKKGKEIWIRDWDEFRLYFHASEERRERQREQTRERVKAYRSKRVDVTGSVTNGNAANQTKPNQTKPTPGDVRGEFEQWWSEVPPHRKVKKAKAFESWDKIAKKWKDPKGRTMIVVLVESLRAFKRTKDWTKDEGTFVPHPTTWLNQRRFEDDLPAMGTGDRAGDEGRRRMAEQRRRIGA